MRPVTQLELHKVIVQRDPYSLCAALINSSGIVPHAWHGGIATVAIFLISVALAAIGLQTELARLLRAGARPLALGFILWVAVAASSLAIQRATGL